MKLIIGICLFTGITGILLDEFYIEKKHRLETGQATHSRPHWPKYVGAVSVGMSVIMFFNKKKKMAAL